MDIMLPLCQCLKINVNELISGESILPEEYLGKAGSIMLLSGVLITLFSFIVVLQNLTPEYLGPNLAVSLLTMGYGILGKIICLILKEKVEYREG